MPLRPCSRSLSLVTLRTSGEETSTLFSASSMSASFLIASEVRDWEGKMEARVREPGVAAPGRCFHTSLRRRASMSRTEEMMSSTASDQTTMTRSSRWERVSMTRLRGGVTHDKRCTLLLFGSAEIQDGVEDLDLVLHVDGKVSVLGATAEGRGGS